MHIDADEFRTALEAIQPFSLADGLRVFYRRYAALHGKTRWGDKTPPYRAIMVEIAQLLPEAYFIHLIRDGRDAALSYRGLWFGPGDEIDAQARFWMEQVLFARQQAASVPNYTEVRFEDLVTDPEAVLQGICAHLNVSYHAQMLDYHLNAERRLAEMTQPFGTTPKTPRDVTPFRAIHALTQRPPDGARIARWRAEMPENEQRRYEAIAGGLLRELGYETRF
jgi:hypothetical protein